jgi:hypothetical protein
MVMRCSLRATTASSVADGRDVAGLLAALACPLRHRLAKVTTTAVESAKRGLRGCMGSL